MQISAHLFDLRSGSVDKPGHYVVRHTPNTCTRNLSNRRRTFDFLQILKFCMFLQNIGGESSIGEPFSCIKAFK